MRYTQLNSEDERVNILTILREQTRAEHDAIERSLGIMSDTLTRQAYRRTLERFYGFWHPLEQRFQQTVGLSGTGVNLTSREKTPLLALDLRMLTAAAPAGLPLCGDLPFVASVPAALGCMYVLEGASLGGQIISRHLRASLGITPESGGRFFYGYGERTGEMWRAFGAAVSVFAVTAETQGGMVQAAIATFRALRRWCEQEDTPSTA